MADGDEEEVARPTVNIYDGPQPYNFEPVRRMRGNEEIPRADGRQRQINAWSEENEWRVGEVSWCLCGRCRPMETVVESLCCREVSAFWSLVEELNPRPADVTCLTQHPGFEACCLNPFVLKIAYTHFRQDHGPLFLLIPRQYRYTAYRQAIRWAYGVLGRSIRKPLPSCGFNHQTVIPEW
uniref:P2X purinoreceptor 7 intracellular domain-containing protein n=1 Tax=Gadus morhua TaxID=8049 RepID=A0A8C5D3V0_GADMO